LLAVIVSIVLLDSVIPLEIKSILYALSLTVKSAIIFVLPAIIFMLLFKTVADLSKKATKVLLFILVGICSSNFLSTMISYCIGQGIYQLDMAISMPDEAMGLKAAFDWTLPSVVKNDIAMGSALLLGILSSIAAPQATTYITRFFEKAVQKLLRIVVCIVPIFISGFVIKMLTDKVLESIIRQYAIIFCLVALSLATYLCCIYLLANSMRAAKAYQSLKNMWPAALCGFSSMSSAAALPLSLCANEKNTQDKNLSRLSTSLSVNIHLIGDCFAIPIFAFAVLKNFGVLDPNFSVYLVFAIYFVLAKFSVAAIPGGGIIVMLPILESQLGFTSEMASLITALYILFDPVITCANICGNGGFAMVLDRLHTFFSKEKVHVPTL